MVKPKPGPQAEKSSNRHSNEFDSHSWLCELVLSHIDESESGKKGKVVKGPVEAEDGVEDDIDESSKLIFAFLINQIEGLLVLDHKLAKSHKLPCFLKMNWVEG